MIPSNGNNYEGELFSIEQVSVAIPDYRSLLLQITIQLTNSKQAHLGQAPVEEEYEQRMLTLLEDLHAGLTSVRTAGDELAPLGKDLLATVQRYKEQVLFGFYTFVT